MLLDWCLDPALHCICWQTKISSWTEILFIENIYFFLKCRHVQNFRIVFCDYSHGYIWTMRFEIKIIQYFTLIIIYYSHKLFNIVLNYIINFLLKLGIRNWELWFVWVVRNIFMFCCLDTLRSVLVWQPLTSTSSLVWLVWVDAFGTCRGKHSHVLAWHKN